MVTAGGGCDGNTRPEKTVGVRPTYREAPRPGTVMMAVISTAKTKLREWPWPIFHCVVYNCLFAEESESLRIRVSNLRAPN